MKDEIKNKRNPNVGSNDELELIRLHNLDSHSSLSFIPPNIFNKNKVNHDKNDDDQSKKSKKLKRNKFSLEEDEKLRDLVQIYGDHSWFQISSLMKTRNPRQCRERWKHYLSCDNFDATRPWSKEEDEIIINKYIELGPKWTKIAKELVGRSDLQVKLRYLKNLQNRKNKEECVDDYSESNDELVSEKPNENKEITNTSTKAPISVPKIEQNHPEIDFQLHPLHEDNLKENVLDDINLNIDFDVMPSNIIMETFSSNENNGLGQFFESDFNGWYFE